jgi:hypothetical protein
MDSPFGTDSDEMRRNFISKFGRMIIQNAIYREIILKFWDLPKFPFPIIILQESHVGPVTLRNKDSSGVFHQHPTLVFYAVKNP